MLQLYACLGSILNFSLVTMILLCLGLVTKTHFVRVRKQNIMVWFQKNFWLPRKRLEIFSCFLKKTPGFVTTRSAGNDPTDLGCGRLFISFDVWTNVANFPCRESQLSIWYERDMPHLAQMSTLEVSVVCGNVNC